MLLNRGCCYFDGFLLVKSWSSEIFFVGKLRFVQSNPDLVTCLVSRDLFVGKSRFVAILMVAKSGFDCTGDSPITLFFGTAEKNRVRGKNHVRGGLFKYYSQTPI